MAHSALARPVAGRPCVAAASSALRRRLLLFSVIVTDFFGREHAGSLVGLLFAITGAMAALGPLGAGFIYDRLGSYHLAWWLSAAFNVLALALLTFTHPPTALPRPTVRRP